MSDWRDGMEKALTDFLTVAELARLAFDEFQLERSYHAAPHCQPSSLPTGRMAVYAFFTDQACLKIGKVGAKSQARYTSQHYNPRSSQSNLAASLVKNTGLVGLSAVNEANVGDWIKINTHRVNILLPASLGIPLLSLLEAFLQARFNPVFEGHARNG